MNRAETLCQYQSALTDFLIECVNEFIDEGKRFDRRDLFLAAVESLTLVAARGRFALRQFPEDDADDE